MIAPWRKAVLCLIGSVAVMAGAYPEAAAAAPAWLAPANVSEEGRSSLQPQVAVDARGDAIAIWSSAEIQATFRPAGGSWQAPVPISAPPGGGSAINATVAMDPKGDAVAVWSLPYPSKTVEFVVQAAFRPAGGNWQPPETISAPGESVPGVAIDRKGNVIAGWSLWNGSHQIVQVASRPAGGTWQAPVDLTGEDIDALGANIAFGPRGEATASWTLVEAGNTIAEVTSKPAGGEWQAPVQLSESGRSATGARVAFDAAGDAVALWELDFDCPGCSLNGEVVQASYRPAGGEWQAPVDVSEGGAKDEGAQVGIDAAGDAVAVWERSVKGSGCCIIQAASKPAGGEWQAPVQLSTGVGGAGRPTLAVAPDGDATALWTVLDESEEVHVQAGMKPAGGEWQAPVEISEPNRSALEQQIAYDSRGDAVAVWRSYDDEGFYLIAQAAAYDAAGPLLEGLSIPATGTPGQPLSFSVSPLDAWSALGATSWTFGDGTGATGTSASHAYAAPGTFTVTVTSEDALGNASSTSREVDISPEPGPEPPTKEPPPKEPPPTPSQPFKVLHMRVKPDGTMVLRLKAPGGGAFGACARMVSDVTVSVSDDHTSKGPAPKRQRGHRQCATVPSGSPVSFFGEGSVAAPGAGVLTLTIRPHKRALKVLRAKTGWHAPVKVTFTPTDGVASSVTKVLARR